ncbi:MAG: hypothetical protein K1Y02_08380 [Candidatus Hydrogenedentes bacterium]|nr:hypothetical protein [Candidatus Hydrogenedentota bacterium]
MLAFIRKLSPSERRLAVLAAVLLAGAVLVVGTIRAIDSIAAMDETIADLQQDLLYYKQQTVQAEAVDKAYQAIATQHSSQWTQEEIHDRLWREIRRLTQKNLPKPGEEAPPMQANNLLVDIRNMEKGTLDNSGEGYRKYTVAFRTEDAPIQNLAQFLERLQQSDQALRVDSLEISRQPATTAVGAKFTVTRTIIGDATTSPPVVEAPAPVSKVNLVRNPSFENWDSQTSMPTDWTADGCTMIQSQQYMTEGQSSVRVTAEKDGASLYQIQNLVAGNTYELSLDLQAQAPATITVANNDGAPLGKGETAKADSGVYTYRFFITVPGEPGATVPIRAPFIVLEAKTSVVTVDNVSLMQTEGKP